MYTSKTIEKGREKAGEEYYATNLMNQEYQYNDRSGGTTLRGSNIK